MARTQPSEKCLSKPDLGGPNSEGSRNGLLAKWFFGGLRYQGKKTTMFQENTGLLALLPKAERPINQYFHEQMRFFGWPINHYGIPLTNGLFPPGNPSIEMGGFAPPRQ